MENNKVSSIKEDPVNILLIYICICLNPIYKFIINMLFIPTNWGANILTTFSLIIGLVSLYYIYNGFYAIGSGLFFLAYFFDTWDGLYARQYKAVTKFGDYYDHICDGIKISGLLIVMMISKKISMKNKIIFVCLFFVLGMLTLWHLGCQQRNYKKRNHKEMLDGLIPMCKKDSDIKYSKFFGTGIIVFTMSLFILSLRYKN